ncbi:MAG: hypothetical protein J6Y35_01670 [Bacteroidales bacterium]|nr:hypothetical protein [Bacteroidales bacterium]MBP5563895.1 hypothetical protein [Bacteroidales bacterium]
MNGGGAGSTGAGKGTTDKTKSAIAKRRLQVKAELKQTLPHKFKAIIRDENGKPKTITIHIENEDYKHLAYNIVDKKVIASTKVKKLNKQLNNSYFKKTSELYKDRPDDNIDKFHYLKVRGRRIYFNIARYKYERKGKRKGTFYYKYRLHAITKNCK